MSPKQLYNDCDGPGNISLVIPRVPTGEGIRLTPRYGPVGYVLCVRTNGQTTALFNRQAIRRFLRKYCAEDIV